MKISKNIGKVERFNEQRGYGFISLMAAVAHDQVFVHQSEIRTSGYRSLRAGDYVLLNVEETPKGLHARDVHVMTADEALRVFQNGRGGAR